MPLSLSLNIFRFLFFFFHHDQHQPVRFFAKEKIRFLSDCQHDTLSEGFFLTFLSWFACLFFNFPLLVCLFICRVVWQVRLPSTFPYLIDWLFFRALFNFHEHQRVIFFLINNRTMVASESVITCMSRWRSKKTQKSPFVKKKKTFAFHSRCGEGRVKL